MIKGETLKIVVDDKIPYIREALLGITPDVRFIAAKDIKNSDLTDVHALIVRTRTRVDERLLGGTPVEFVATATIGFDHIDREYLDSRHIEWMSCPGCNASSVAQYVECALLLLKRHKNLNPKNATLGVVGYGNVGKKVALLAREMGFNMLICDPPLFDSGALDESHTLEELAQKCDVITFHTPLTRSGKYKTLHLADEMFFESLKRKPVIINTSRGEVVNNALLLQALNQKTVREAVIDTWEGEPNINLCLLERAFIATPHIAGYSADGKTNADNMVLRRLCQHFFLPQVPAIVPPELPEEFFADRHDDDERLVYYNPLDDTLRLKHAPLDFERLRGDYPLRREMPQKA